MAVDLLAAQGDPDVSLRVDEASGAMIAPFIDPDLVSDSRLPRFASINMSRHGYDLVDAGIG